MKKHIIFLRIAGSISLVCLLSHIAFYKMFDWQHSLNCLSQLDRSIMLTYHFIILLFFAFMSFVPLIQAKALLNSSLKPSILIMFSLLYLIRIITEFTLFGFRGNESLILLIICVIPMILFTIPIFYKSEN